MFSLGSRCGLLARWSAPALLAAGLLAGCATPSSVGDDLLRAGKVDQAVNHLQGAAAARPQDAEVHASLGAALRRAGRPEEAEAQLRTALTLVPDHRRARRELLGLLIDQRRLVAAATAADELRRVAPDDPAVRGEAYVELLDRAGQQALETHQLAAAVTLLERLQQLRPAKDEAGKQRLIAAYVGQARLLAEGGRTEEALRAVERALTQGGESAALLEQQGTLLVALARPEDAARSFDRLVELAPDRSEAARQAGAALRKAGANELAVRFYEQAVRPTATKPGEAPPPAAGAPARSQDLLTLAALWLQLGQPVRAREALDRYVTARGATAEALGEAARSADEGGNGELARGYLRRAADAAPANYPRQEALAELLIRQGRRDEALETIERYRQAAPPAEAHFQAAQWYRGQGEFDRALAAYRQALVATPERTLIHLRVAEVLHELRRPEERRAALDRFVQTASDKLAAQRKVAGIYGDSGDVQGALRYLDAAARQAPSDPSLQQDRARIFEQAKQPEREEEAWRAYVQASSEPATAAREVALRYAERGDLERALAFVQLGLQSARDPELRLGLQLIELDLQQKLDDEPAVRETLRRLLAEPADDTAKARLLQEALRTMRAGGGDPVLALPLLEALLQLRPEQADLYRELGEAQLQQRSWSAAAQAFDRFEQYAPDKVAALSLVARAYSAAERPDLALRTMNRLVAMGETDPRTLQQVIELRLEQSGPGDEQTLALLERLLASPPPAEIDLLPLALKLEQWRLFGAAEKTLRYADARQPLGPRDLDRLGRMLLQQRRVDEAREVLTRLEQRSSPEALAKVRLSWGQVSLEVGLPALAVELYAAVLERGEGPLHQAFQLAADALRQTGDRARLQALATRYVAKASPPEEVHAAVARAWSQLGDDPRALESWKRTLVYDPLSQEALQQVASILMRQGDAAGAGRFIERQIKEAGDQPEAWLGLARRYRRYSAHAEAVHYYDLALAKGSDPATTLLERGLSLLALGRRQEGRESIDQALAQARGETAQSALEEAGQQYVSIGWDEQAIAIFQRGLAQDRTNERFYAILIELHLRSGRLDLARRVVADARANGMSRLYSAALSFEEAGYPQQAQHLYRQLLEQGQDGQVQPAFWRLGLELVDRGRADELAPLAQRFLAAVHDSFAGQWLVSLLYTRAGRHDRALQHLLAGAERGGEGMTDRAWLIVAEAALRAGRPATALDAFQRWVARPEADTDDASAAVELLLQRGEPELAAALLDRLGGEVLGPAQSLLARAKLALQQNDLWQATRLLRRMAAVAKDGERAELVALGAAALLEAHLLAEADALLDLAGGTPTKEIRLLQLQLRAEQGQAGGIEAALEAYLGASPVDEAGDRIQAGALLRGSGLYARAEALLHRGMELAASEDERRVALYHLLACLLAEGKDAEVAVEARRFVARSAAPLATVHEVIGELDKLERWELALELLTRHGGFGRTDHRLLQDLLNAKLALGQEGQLDTVVEDIGQQAFSAESDTRTRAEILGRVAARLAWSLRTAEALQRWEQILAAAPAEFEPLERMVGAGLGAGDDALVAALAPRFLRAAGERPATWRWLADRLVEYRRGAQALPVIERLTAAAPTDLRSHLLGVSAALLARDEAQARRATKEALAIADDVPRARVALATLWLQGGQPLPDVAEEGAWFFADTPATWLREAVELVQPVCGPGADGYAAGLLVRGLARLRLGEKTGATTDFDEFLRRGGGYSVALLEPFPYEERNELDIEKLTELLADRMGEAADGPGRLLLIIDAYLAAGDEERAWPLVEKLASLADDPEEALGRVLQRAALHGRVELGMKVMERVSRRFPGNVWETTMLAELLEQGGRRQAAIEAYRRGIEREPWQPVFYNNLAYFYAREGINLDEALALVRKARRLGPQGEKYYLDTEAWVLHRAGRDQEALPLVQASVWLMDRGQGAAVAESFYHLGAIRLGLGQVPEGLAALRHAAAVDARGRYGDLARQELARRLPDVRPPAPLLPPPPVPGPEPVTPAAPPPSPALTPTSGQAPGSPPRTAGPSAATR